MCIRDRYSNVGGHIASFASAAALYDVGFSWFWRAPSEERGGDLIFFQGHSVPGIYARAHLLGRLTDEQMDSFRQEVDGKGISSYPHPWLMPDFWQFPTVSMGLGPLQAIYHARFMKLSLIHICGDAFEHLGGRRSRIGRRHAYAPFPDGTRDRLVTGHQKPAPGGHGLARYLCWCRHRFSLHTKKCQTKPGP